MADVHAPEQRSYNMSQIRSRNTKSEELVRKYLFAQGFLYRKKTMSDFPESRTSSSPSTKH